MFVGMVEAPAAIFTAADRKVFYQYGDEQITETAFMYLTVTVLLCTLFCQKLFQICFRCADWGNLVVLNKIIQHIG